MVADDRVWREQILRSAVLGGDVRAWQSWYEESYGKLYAYVGWRCAGVQDLVEDVVQETWLIAVRRIRSFDPGRGSFVGWLRGIAGHAIQNRLRRRKRHVSLSRRMPLPAGGVETALALQETAERVALALAAVPRHYERVLQAKYVDQQSVGDIALEWQETPKAIESLLTRAREAFRKAYQRLENSDNE